MKKTTKSKTNTKKAKLTYTLIHIFLVAGVLVFAATASFHFGTSKADSYYYSGNVTFISGTVRNVDKIVTDANPHLWLSRCGATESCTYRWFFVKPTPPAGKQWTSYKLVRSPLDSYSHVLSDTARVNAKFDWAVTSNTNNFGYTYVLQYFSGTTKSTLSGKVTLPTNPGAYPRPKPAPTATPVSTPTPKVTPTPTKTTPTPTPTDGDSNDNPAVDDGEIGGDFGVDDGSGTIELGGDLLSGIFGSDWESELGDVSLTQGDESVSSLDELSGSDMSQLGLNEKANTSNKKLSDYGYSMSLYCTNKTSKNSYKLVSCDKSNYLFLAINGPDKDLKKEQLTYRVKLKDSNIKIASVAGCSTRTLEVGKQKVEYCAAVYRDKSNFANVKDSLQTKIFKLFYKIKGSKYIEKKDQKASNFQKEKSQLDAKTYLASASYKSYKPIVSGGTLKFKISSDKLGNVLDVAKQKDCEKGGGTYSDTNCSKAPFSYSDSKLESSSWSINSSSSKYTYDEPSNMVLQAVINTISH